MIGVDEFNYRSRQPAESPVGDIRDTDYIAAYLLPGSRVRNENKILIDIVLPQSHSRNTDIPGKHRSSMRNGTQSSFSGKGSR